MRRLAPYLLILAAVLLVYCPALRNGFVWDDTALVLRDPLTRSPWLLLEGFRHFLFLDATAADFYRPLQRAIFTFDYYLAGFTPWVFHLTSLLVHAGAAIALYEFGRRLLEKTEASVPLSQLPFAVALLWAVHPIHSSAVVYIAGLADPLAALLGFGGLALLLAGRPRTAGLCLGAALFAKESGVFALVIGLGFAWALACKESADWRPRLVRFARVAIPALLMTGLYLGLRATAEHTRPPQMDHTPLAERPVLVLRAVAEYAGLLVAPVNLHMERTVKTPTGTNLQTIAGALLLCGAAFWFSRSTRTGRACLLAALVAYLPVSNLFALNATAAEHWVYVPSAFLLLAAAATLRQFPVADRRIALLATGILALWFVALGCRTAWRCGDWRDQWTFLQATIHAGGNSSRMIGNLAQEKLKRGDIEGAVQDFRAALALKPDQPFAMLGLSGALIKARSFDESRQWLERCEKVPLIQASALVNRAVLEFQESRSERVDLFREAAAVNPRFWPVRKLYITHLLARGETSTALQELRAVLQDQPFRAETWEMMGLALEKNGESARAQDAYAEADRRDFWRERKESKTY